VYCLADSALETTLVSSNARRQLEHLPLHVATNHECVTRLCPLLFQGREAVEYLVYQWQKKRYVEVFSHGCLFLAVNASTYVTSTLSISQLKFQPVPGFFL